MKPADDSARSAAVARRRVAPVREMASGILWVVFLGIFALLLIPKIGAPRNRNALLFTGHILAGTLVLGLGPLQFIGRVRNRFRRFHRVCGRVIIGASLVSIGCLYALLPNTLCNACLPSQVTVTTLWLVCIVAGWLAIRRRDVGAHRRHMARAFVCASYFVLVRVVDHIGIGRLLPFVSSESARYANSDWLAWLIPLFLVEAFVSAQASAGRVVSSDG